jgi:hypothetical protein
MICNFVNKNKYLITTAYLPYKDNYRDTYDLCNLFVMCFVSLVPSSYKLTKL